jgi:hypothetical protein
VGTYRYGWSDQFTSELHGNRKRAVYRGSVRGMAAAIVRYLSYPGCQPGDAGSTSKRDRFRAEHSKYRLSCSYSWQVRSLFNSVPAPLNP